MKDMYEIVPRGNEYIYGKILLDNFNVCHSCRQFYPIDRCPDAVLADPKLLSKRVCMVSSYPIWYITINFL